MSITLRLSPEEGGKGPQVACRSVWALSCKSDTDQTEELEHASVGPRQRNPGPWI